MTNSGRPSKGCRNCRERKIKVANKLLVSLTAYTNMGQCDQKRPSCTQCLKAHKECHGYRDLMKFMFRDESDVVVRKATIRYQELARAKVEKKQIQATQRFGNGTTSVYPPYSQHHPAYYQCFRRQVELLPAPTYEPLLDSEGICFFLSNWVQQPSIVPRCQFEFLPELLEDPNNERVLRASVAAAGLSGLAVTTKSPQIMKKAREQYGIALRLTNQALQSAAMATKDSTLVSVILLSMYEHLQSEEVNASSSWTKHIGGACALVSLRGPELIQRDMGHRIFRQLYAILLLAASEKKTAVPQPITELWNTYVEGGNHKVFGEWSVYEMVRRMRRVMFFISQHDSTVDLWSRVTTAIQHDQDLDCLEKGVPKIFAYRTKFLGGPREHVYGRFYHIYLDPWIVQMWNQWRVSRIHLHRIICAKIYQGIEQLPHIFTPEIASKYIQASEQIMRACSDAICASTPQITGQIPFPDLPADTRFDTSDTLFDLFDEQNPSSRLHPRGTCLKTGRPTSMQYLAYPIYQAAAWEEGPTTRKDWAIDALHFLARNVGTKQAVLYADDLKQSNKSAFPPKSSPFAEVPSKVEGDGCMLTCYVDTPTHAWTNAHLLYGAAPLPVVPLIP